MAYDNIRYQEALSQRDLTTPSAYGSGPFIIPFEVPSDCRWFPKRSYLRAPTTLYNSAGNALKLVDGIGFAINPLANTFQSVQLRLNNQVLAEIASGNVGQIDTLLKRMYMSKAQIDTTLRDTEWFNASLDERIAAVSVDGRTSQMVEVGYPDLKDNAGVSFNAVNTIAMTTGGLITFAAGVYPGPVPPPGPGPAPPDVRQIFQTDDILQIGDNSFVVASTPSATTVQLVANTAYVAIVAAAISTFSGLWRQRQIATERAQHELLWDMSGLCPGVDSLPGGSWSLYVVPYSDYKTRMIESRTAKTTADFTLQIQNVYLDFCTADTSGPMESRVEQHTFDNVALRQNPLTSGTSKSEIRYDIPSCTGVTVATQPVSAGNDTRFPVSKFVLPQGAERYLSLFDITFRGQHSNQPQLTPQFTAGDSTTMAVAFLRHMWRLCMQNTSKWYREGGCEAYSEWAGPVDMGGSQGNPSNSYGMYYHHKFKTAPGSDNKDTSCIVTSQYSVNPSASVTANQIVFAHYKRKAAIKVENGRAVQFEVMDVS